MLAILPYALRISDHSKKYGGIINLCITICAVTVYLVYARRDNLYISYLLYIETPETDVTCLYDIKYVSKYPLPMTAIMTETSANMMLVI